MSLREFFVLVNHLSSNSVYLFEITPTLEKIREKEQIISDPDAIERLFDEMGR